MISSAPFCSARSTYRTRRSGVHSTWRMPSATVPVCSCARSPSSRSSTIVCWPVANTVSGILRLVSNVRPDSVTLPRARASLNSSCLLAVRQHDEAALGAGHLDRRVEHHRQHLVEDPARPERAQVLEQGRHLPQLARRRHRALLHRRRLVVDEEDDLGVAGLAEPDLIAVRQHLLAVLFAVDERAEPRLLVADDADCRSRC